MVLKITKPYEQDFDSYCNFYAGKTIRKAIRVGGGT